MRACVVGGGPAGIFISKNLSEKGIEVDLIERENRLMGNYNYARDKIDIIKNIQNNEKIKVYLNSDHHNIEDDKYDFYVFATGGIQRPLEIKGKKNAHDAIDIIKNICSHIYIEKQLPMKFNDDMVENTVIGNDRIRTSENKVSLTEQSKMINQNKSNKLLSWIGDNIDLDKENSYNFSNNVIKSLKIISSKLMNKNHENLKIFNEILGLRNDSQINFLKTIYNSILNLVFGFNSSVPTLNSLKNKKIVIIGMGNVCLDLISYLDGIVKEITVLCRSSLLKASFDNYVFREIVNSRDYDIKIESKLEEPVNRTEMKRLELVKTIESKNHSKINSPEQEEYSSDEVKYNRNISTLNSKIGNSPQKIFIRVRNPVSKSGNPRPRLNLIFDANPVELSKDTILYTVNNKLRKECFDFAVNSTGFIPNKIDFKTEKPVYHLGWCEKAKGNIGDSAIDARNLTDKILNEIKLY
jgi:thioredoxin reductase